MSGLGAGWTRTLFRVFADTEVKYRLYCVYEPQFVKTYASPSQTKWRYRRSKFVVCTIARRSEFSSCCLRDRCSFLTGNFVCPGVYAVSSCHLWDNQLVTGISNVNLPAQLLNVPRMPAGTTISMPRGIDRAKWNGTKTSGETLSSW